MIQEFNLFDDYTGEHVLRSVKKVKPKLGRGWMAFYKKALKTLIQRVPNLSTLKVYLHLASKQTYQMFVMTTYSQIQKDLKMSSSTVYEALKWLKENEYLQVHNVEGNTGFLLNSNVTTQGAQTRKTKAEIWSLTKQKAEVMSKTDMELAAKKNLLDSINSLLAERIDYYDGDEEPFETNEPNFSGPSTNP